MEKFDFSGWATRHNVKCSDGRTIMKDAFKHNDGQTVPLVWNHQHNDPTNVIGHALLEYRDAGVYTYGSFNNTPLGTLAKEQVRHRDITALSIYANQLKERGGDVFHGAIREVSLVLAGANPEAFIDSVIMHSDDEEFEATIYTGEEINLYHADGDKKEESKEEKPMSEETKKTEDNNEKTIKEIFDEFTPEQKEVVYAITGLILEEEKGKSIDEKTEGGSEGEENKNIKHSEGGNETMKENLFDKETKKTNDTLSHSDQETILNMAKQSNVGSLKMAMDIFAEEQGSEMAHGFETTALEALVPDYKNLNPGAPEIVRPDQSWVMSVINKIHKSPYSRIRTRQADARIAELKAKGYQNKGDRKTLTNTIRLIGRTFDPQTVYIRDDIHRDDIVDITDFDYVSYVWNLMNDNMYETLALAALVGDGRDDTDPDKIHETHIHSIFNDTDPYTIHTDVDFAAAAAELNGTNTGANFGENYIYAEAIITAALYSRERFKGTGRPDLYCTPHLVNVMLLARDLNGRRIYDSKADLAKALNVGEIHEIEQLEGKTRVDDDNNTKKLLGIFVNLTDYQFGSTKGGEVTRFDDFDIDFNKHKYLLETRLSGALTKLYSAIVLEEPVPVVEEGSENEGEDAAG